MLAIYLAALDSADNAEAFEAVYERYKRLVYHVACQIVHDPHLAEDVAQEVFLYIAKNFSRLHRQDPHKFAAYLVSCTRSRAFLLLAQRPDAPGEEEPDFDRNADPAPVPEDAVIDEQQAQHLMQAVQQLAPIYRDPLRLLAQGYTYREIAAALALRESTVRQRIARRAVYTAILRFLPIETQVTYSVDGTPLDALPENYCDHYVPEGFVLDEESELRDSYQFFRSYHSADNQIYFIDCVIINDSFISTFDNEHTVWQETNVNDCPATLGTTTIQGHVSHALIWEKDGIYHSILGELSLTDLYLVAESIS